MFEMNLPALQNDLEELQTLRRELNAHAEELDALTETRLAQRPDILGLKLEFAPPAETELRLEAQTRDIRITW